MSAGLGTRLEGSLAVESIRANGGDEDKSLLGQCGQRLGVVNIANFNSRLNTIGVDLLDIGGNLGQLIVGTAGDSPFQVGRQASSNVFRSISARESCCWLLDMSALGSNVQDGGCMGTAKVRRFAMHQLIDSSRDLSTSHCI